MIDCQPAVSSVAEAVATPELLKADNAPIEPPPKGTESVNVTVSVKLVTGLPKASSTVTESVSLAVLLAVGVLFESLISN